TLKVSSAAGCFVELLQKTSLNHMEGPQDNKLKRQIWTVALRRRDFEPNDRSVVCSHHFKSEDFDRTGQTTRLREGVIPSVFIFTNQLHKVGITGKLYIYTDVVLCWSPSCCYLEGWGVVDLQCFGGWYMSNIHMNVRTQGFPEKLEELRSDLRNAKDRERRHKKTMKTLLKDLKQKCMLTEELQQKLDLTFYECCHHGVTSIQGF
uniref:THAP-type domain-containing protein n=1 Tax=Amphiprion percula TaxID=161767 RepID=A0A3P8UDK3_AMPPE